MNRALLLLYMSCLVLLPLSCVSEGVDKPRPELEEPRVEEEETVDSSVDYPASAPLEETEASKETEPVQVTDPEFLEPDLPVFEQDTEPFDPSSIPQAVFDSTKTDVQILIEQLNELIRAQEYDAWVSYLGKDYLFAISDPDFLAKVSESARLKSQNIVLNDLRDYFVYVVVPSRTNDRVDDIEFIGQNRVKAYTITGKGQRLRLYDLEKTDGRWKIVN